MTATVKLKEKKIRQTVSSFKKNDLKGIFAEKFYQQIPSEDLLDWDAKDLSAIASTLFDGGNKRKQGETILRIYTPTVKKNGWGKGRTVIEIINDDMPFLIDSIAAELAHYDLSLEVLFHPIIKLCRDEKKYEIQEIHVDDVVPSHALIESYIHIQLEEELPESVCQHLNKRLTTIINDVKKATFDWRPMLAQLKGVIQEMSHLPRNLDQDDVNEARSFMQYLHNNNFTFLGYRRDVFERNKKGGICTKTIQDSGLGILKGGIPLNCEGDGFSPEAEALVNAKLPVLVGKLVDQYSTVHRRVPLDAVSIKIFDAKGNLAGQHLFLGLFTSLTYSCRTTEVPLIRQKVQETLTLAKFGHDSHDHKALEHILEKFPRDELFQVSVEDLVETSLGILRLHERQRTALFTRIDPMERYVSCLVYVPRDHFDSEYRKKAALILEKSLGGECSNFFTTLDDSPLARILFTIVLKPGSKPKIEKKEMERELIELGRGWYDSLKHYLVEGFGKEKGMELLHRYGRSFSASYEAAILPHQAIHDIRHIEDLLSGDPIKVDMYKLNEEARHELRMKVYHKGAPVPLSDILPVLENMGLRCISENPFEVEPSDHHEHFWIHNFAVEMPDIEDFDLAEVKQEFEKAFTQVWFNNAENDGLNELILRAGLTWHEVVILRSYTNFLRQAKYPFSRHYIEQTLSWHPSISKRIVRLFKVLHDPFDQKDTERRAKKISKEINSRLQKVEQLDQDRILRSFKSLVEHTLRTNYFQKEADGSPKPWLSMKFDSKNINELPLPRPAFEIFVYSTRLEAVHLRGGKIARGGLRWSDRHDDFRTEVLGLMKSQMVKNSVIVPVGSKGGFIVKNPPKTGGREAFMAEGIACYKMFIQAMLEITDNNVGNKIVRPKDVVCYDEEDPYLVVAADKGTATFSDFANELSLKAGFWLGDAFASGGSSGYDHKVMGITAKGGWESVKRHFRELGKDIQSEDFTVMGVGDMGGDVFGNGMLLSKHIRLIGTFNHLHIFCDPNPDAALSFKERLRLFKSRGGWDQYDIKKMSKGARIFERSAKKIKLTPEIKKVFGLDKLEVTPNELMRAMLLSKAELLWFGGIGTYIKSSKESNADADDKNNDALRVDARDLKSKVIGEGANLGCTQLGRIQFARRGGKNNTDFIDNSAGVDCSDHEVNIKILLSDVMSKSDMDFKARDKLLAKMTESVSELVLWDNYQQTQAISFSLSRGPGLLPRYAGFIRELEREGYMERSLEGLPDEETIQQMLQEKRGLSRPELSVLLSYAKIAFYNDLLVSDIPDEEGSQSWLFDYFPKDLLQFEDEIKNHKLKREIIATSIANSLTNRMGPVFVSTRMDKTGAKADEVVRAFMIVMQAFDLAKVWEKIETLDNKVPVDVQLDAMRVIFELIKWSVTWLLRRRKDSLAIADNVIQMGDAVKDIKKCLKRAVPADIREGMDQMKVDFIERGMPDKLAETISLSPVLVSACDIIDIHGHCQSDIKAITKAYFEVGAALRLDWLREKARNLAIENHWEARVLGSFKDDLYSYQASITLGVINEIGCPVNSNADIVVEWAARHEEKINQFKTLLREIENAQNTDLAMLVLAGQHMGQLVKSEVRI